MTALVHNRDAAATLAKYLTDARQRILDVIPPHMSVDRICGVIQNEFARNEYLRECEPRSIVRAVVQAAELGLDPSPKLGQVFFIPRNKKVKKNGAVAWEKHCEMQIGYKGMVARAYRCERILSVDAVLVHEKDDFHIARGTEPKVVHRYTAGNRGEVVCGYFAARLTPWEGNIWRVDDMSIADILAIRDRSESYRKWFQAKQRGESWQPPPWETDRDEMCRKTILIRGLKTCPIDDKFRAALDADADEMRTVQAPTEPSTRAQELKDKLGMTPPADVDDAEVEEVGDD